jgi:hypothetical protein
MKTINMNHIVCDSDDEIDEIYEALQVQLSKQRLERNALHMKLELSQIEKEINLHREEKLREMIFEVASLLK